MGTSYSKYRAENERHVVVCSSTSNPNIIMDFLNEFYAHPKLQVIPIKFQVSYIL